MSDRSLSDRSLSDPVQRVPARSDRASDPAGTQRTAAWLAVAGGAVAAVGALVTAVVPPAVPGTRLSHPYEAGAFVVTEVIWTLAHVAMLVGTVGLARSGLLGPSGAGRAGIRTAIAGMALVAVSEFGFAFYPTSDADAPGPALLSALIGVATLVAAGGFLVAGVAALRAGVWSGWGRWTPLLCGAVVVVALLPVLALVGDSPTAFLVPVALWSATFVLLGVALLSAGAGGARR